MTQSIVEFAKEFENLKGRIKLQSSGSMRLRTLIAFWTQLSDRQIDRRFRTYIVEYTTLLLQELNTSSLYDLLPNELSSLNELVPDLANTTANAQRAEELKSNLIEIAKEAARKHFYVGDVSTGIGILSDVSNIQPLDLDFSSADSSHSEIEHLRLIYFQLKGKSNFLYQLVGEILSDWDSLLQELSINVANSLLVEVDSGYTEPMGRLLKLSGSVKTRNGHKSNEEVTFENQLVSPDDPFAGAIYDSLKAVKLILARFRFDKSHESHFEGRYGIKNVQKQTLSGDSIGLAAGLIAYTQLLDPMMLRYERFITGEAAFTGGIDEAGKILPVNDKTLGKKK